MSPTPLPAGLRSEFCPECGRKPSERQGEIEAVCGDCNYPRPSESCCNATHDIADRAPQMLALIKKMVVDLEVAVEEFDSSGRPIMSELVGRRIAPARELLARLEAS